MIRNIPNRVNVDMLKQLLDTVCAGCYDFLYLRIGLFLAQFLPCLSLLTHPSRFCQQLQCGICLCELYGCMFSFILALQVLMLVKLQAILRVS